MLILLDVVSLAMFLRVILSLFSSGEDSRFYTFLAFITEPFIIPVRLLMQRFNILQDSPIDWSFTFAYILLALVQTMLPII